VGKSLHTLGEIILKIKIVKKEDSDKKIKLLRPMQMYGAKQGTIFQMVNTQREDDPNPTYFIGCGCNEFPVSLWYDEENSTYRMSVESGNDLESFNNHIFVKKIKAKVKIKLELK